jgi:hypothetical protein
MRITVTCILKEKDVRVWYGFNWLRVGTSDDYQLFRLCFLVLIIAYIFMVF